MRARPLTATGSDCGEPRIWERAGRYMAALFSKIADIWRGGPPLITRHQIYVMYSIQVTPPEEHDPKYHPPILV